MRIDGGAPDLTSAGHTQSWEIRFAGGGTIFSEFF